jgi:predicted secreted protein
MTAVEYLITQIKSNQEEKCLSVHEWLLTIKEAKAREKKQIIESYNEGYRDGEHDKGTNPKDIAEYSNAEQYYNENFKKAQP